MNKIKRARVFITHMQPARFDYTGLTEYGEIVALTGEGERWITDGSASMMQAQIAQRLWDFDEDRDFIVSTGSAILTAAIFTILGRMGVGRLQLLNFQRDIGYVLMNIDIEGAVIALESAQRNVTNTYLKGVQP